MTLRIRGYQVEFFTNLWILNSTVRIPEYVAKADNNFIMMKNKKKSTWSNERWQKSVIGHSCKEVL